MTYLFRRSILFIILLSFTFLLSAQTRPIGINLAGIEDWSTEYVFADAFKQSREWISFDSTPGAEWSSGVEIPLNESGYPLEIPYNDGTNPPQLIRTLMFFGNNMPYPSGGYRLIVEGTGQISLWGAASGTFACPVDTVVDVNSSSGGIALEINQSEKTDPVKNIRFLMPGYHDTTYTNPFYPKLLSFLDDFSVIRFMDWMKTNNSPVVEWADRNTKDYYTQTLDKGIAYEYIIDLCNLKNINPWICIPHQANDDFISQMAQLFRDSLNPDLKLYIEYSNEVWNGIFGQHQYAAQKALEEGYSGEEWERAWIYTAKRSADVFRIFENEFENSSRLIKVIPGFAANSWVTNKILEHFNDPIYNPDHITADALAIAPYFGGSVANTIGDAGLMGSITVDGLMDSLQASLSSAFSYMEENKTVADSYNMKLIAYEGGQHLVASATYYDNTEFVEKLLEANRNEQMEKLYKDYFDYWYDSINGGMFCYFSSHGNWGKYGSWGVKENYDDTLSPKYTALQKYVFTDDQEEDSTIIPEDRMINWNPGLPEGIPNISSPVKNILDFGADPDGQEDSYQSIVSAINSLPSSGGVVFIPEGTYKIGSKVSIGKSNVVIRGEGKKTKLLTTHESTCFEVITYQRGAWQNLLQGVEKNKRTIKVENSSAFSPGKFAEIEQENNPDLMYSDPEWIQDWAINAVGQFFEVENIKGDSITFKAPTNFTYYDSLNARIRPQGLVSYVGFENFYIERLITGGSNITFKNAAYCWIKDVESYHTRYSHISAESSLGLEIRDSYFHRSFSYGDRGSGYGVAFGFHVTNSLVENNVFDSLRHAMMVHVGANGNVFGYNYSINPVQGDGETNLNQGWRPPDISIHGHYPFMNLFEGNEVEEIGIGDYWGPSGPGNTYFRNKVNGEGIFYYDLSHYQNLVGNTTTYLIDDSGKSKYKLEHGNKIGQDVVWDLDISNHDLPSSLYLDSVPSFFNDYPWPPFGPGISGENKLPAQIWLESIPFIKVSLDRNPVKKYERLEIAIENGQAYSNPFDPDEVDIYGYFTSPSGDSMRINAFWDGSYWKIRFAGDETGTWQYSITIDDDYGLLNKTGSFEVINSQNHGWVKVSEKDPHYLSFDDDKPFFGVGMAIPWKIGNSEYYKPGLFSDLQENGINYVNWLFTSWDITLLRDSFDRYSMDDASKFDVLLNAFEYQDIKMMLGIWIHDLLREAPHPWNSFYDWQSNPFNQLTSSTEFFSDSISWEYQKKYYRYIIARWGYSPSIAMWHTVAEIDGTNAIYNSRAMENNPEGWHNKINKYFIENDPFHHPTTVSGSSEYDFDEGWQVTEIPQVHVYPSSSENISENPERIAYWADKLFNSYEKPVLIGEFGKSTYEDGISESFLHNGIWAGLMSGASSTPLHWWGGQISEQPENFSKFTEKMMNQLYSLKNFVASMDMASYGFKPLYSKPVSEQIELKNMPNGKAFGLKGDSTLICWIYEVSEFSENTFQEVEVTIPALPEGKYTISFYDTWNGEWNKNTLFASTSDNILTFACPYFQSDIAIKIEHTGINTGIKNPDYGALLKAFPNPCKNVLNVNFPSGTESIQLLNLTGQVVHNRNILENKSHIQMDLSPLASGIYLLKSFEKNKQSEILKIIHP